MKPYHYIHVLDGNSNITRLEIGPQNFYKQDHEKIMSGKEAIKMVMLDPFTYIEIRNPVMRSAEKALVLDDYGQVKLRHGDTEVRTSMDYTEPFPLYPGESIDKQDKIITIPRDHVARLECLRNYHDEEAELDRAAGDEWIIKGPTLYIPRVEVKLEKIIAPEVIRNHQALKIKARRNCVDHKGVERKAGDQWIIKDKGFYTPMIDEDVVEKLIAYVITEDYALHLKAKLGYTDVYGNVRKDEDEWLITSNISAVHILGVHEQFVQEVPITVLSEDDYCYINDPIDERGVNQLGKKILRAGPLSFFIQPNESIDGGIKKIYILSAEEALLLKAQETFSKFYFLFSSLPKWRIHFNGQQKLKIRQIFPSLNFSYS
jgi:major vault protein